MATLVLPLKAVYFNAIKAGTKTKEYRLVTPYWRKRLEGREYDDIVLTLGYPAADDESRRLRRAWRGFTVETIQHEHFGAEPVQVFAIDVEQSA
jgi:hypothetical protein